ncbi:MAG: YwiC-like family protein [Gemmatimonadota bacterium]
MAPDTPGRSAARGPSLKPREHGAYAMAAFPVLSGFLLGGVEPATVGLALAVIGSFAAHEPLAVLLGVRGARLKDRLGPAARRVLGVWSGVVAVGVGLFLLGTPPDEWVTLLLPAALGAGVAVTVLRGRARTLAGELLVAAAFASIHVPMAAVGAGLAGDGAWWRHATVWAPALVWLCVFSLSALAVHRTISRFKGLPAGWAVRRVSWIAALLAGLGGWAGAGAGGWGPAGAGSPPPLLGAVAPAALILLVLTLVPVHPRNLRRVGWTMVVADTLTLVMLGVLAMGGGQG